MTGEMRIYAIDLHIRDIRSWVIEQKFTPHGLAKKCGLGPGTLANMMDPSWNPSVSTLRMIDNYKNDHENEQQERQKSFEELLWYIEYSNSNTSKNTTS